MLCPGNLGSVNNFKNTILEAKSDLHTQNIYFCCGHVNPINMSQSTTACSFLLGSYLIMFDNASYDEVVAAFQPVSQWFLSFPEFLDEEREDDQISVLDCWRALSTAKLNGWIDFQSDEVDVEKCIDMMEYEHYDNPLNGAFHVIIPSRLIAFRRPSELPAVQDREAQWQDVGGVRHFGPFYYADMLSSEFGVQILVRVDEISDALSCDEDESEGSGECSDGFRDDEREVGRENEADSVDEDTSGTSTRLRQCTLTEWVGDYEDQAFGNYEENAFGVYGIGVERLGAPHRRGRRLAPQPLGSLLRDLDRFLTLERLSPGALAIHGDRRGERGGGDWLGVRGEAMVAALLMEKHGFDGLSALAWIRLAHPASAPPPLAFSPAPDPPPASRSGPPVGWRRARRFSGSAPALLLAEPAPLPAVPIAESRAVHRLSGKGFGRGPRGDLTVATVLAAAAAATPPASAEAGDWSLSFRLGPEVKLGRSVSAVGPVELGRI
jgi:hypothetical protein